ncbi:hypothetical protein [Pseudoduganella aquatica]|uniref:hypothetical protein n=1 Tax=Pseudoduganella aquatica TaxID=2660641 RepID=UPI001E45E279|nr:hypothetical protein [Pseudoduganella aquatica]
MSNYNNMALFGNMSNPGYMDAQSLNANAVDPNDWATVAANGLQQIIKARIEQTVADKQQQYGVAPVTVSAPASMNMFLLIGLAVLLMKD